MGTGKRIWFWRMAAVLQETQVPPMINVLVEGYPVYIVEHQEQVAISEPT